MNTLAKNFKITDFFKKSPPKNVVIKKQPQDRRCARKKLPSNFYNSVAIKNRQMGNKNEKLMHGILNSWFNGNFDDDKSGWREIDFIDKQNKYGVELKSRNITFDRFDDILMGKNKWIRSRKMMGKGYKCFFFWKLLDGIYFYPVPMILPKCIKTNIGGTNKRGKEEWSDCLYVPTKIMYRLNDYASYDDLDKYIIYKSIKCLKMFLMFLNIIMDCDKNNLFPEINPNLDEIVELESVIDADDVLKDDVDFDKPKSTHAQIFKERKPTENVKLKVEDKPKDVVKKTRDYSHLAAARKKGAETRRRKAEEKRKAKAEAKAAKEEEKRLRKQATMERNREKARARYYKQKEAKKNETIEVAKEIVETTKPKYQYKQQPPKPNGMDFNTFAKYMMKYEGMKEAYNKQKAANQAKKQKQRKPQHIPRKEEPKKSFHPQHYPLANFTNPALRHKEWGGF